MDDMNDSRSWAQGSRFYEQLRIVVNLNDSRSQAQGSRCYEWIRYVYDMIHS